MNRIQTKIIKGKRYDNYGNLITKNGKQRVTFIDKVKLVNLIEVIQIESFKEYNVTEEKKEDNLGGRSKENNVAYAIVNVFKWEKIIEHSKLFSKNQNTQALNNNNRKFEPQSNTQDDNREIISNERSKQIRKDKAAKLLGISQKTLYHYEKEIKEAFKNKYDFMENYKRKINHLYLHNKKFN